MERRLDLYCVIEREATGFSALCLDLDIATCGQSLEDVVESMKDAILTYLDYAVSSGREEELVPRPVPRDVRKRYEKSLRQKTSEHQERLRREAFDHNPFSGQLTFQPRYAR